MHRFTPCAPSDTDEIEIAMLDLLLEVAGSGNGPLREPALSAIDDAQELSGVPVSRQEACRTAARLLRDRAIALGADPRRYRTMGWLTLGL